jgi:hypothetical protein
MRCSRSQNDEPGRPRPHMLPELATLPQLGRLSGQRELPGRGAFDGFRGLPALLELARPPLRPHAQRALMSGRGRL